MESYVTWAPFRTICSMAMVFWKVRTIATRELSGQVRDQEREFYG